MVGQTISHYRITEKLGEGGMGVVYKAQDTRLKRIVALKFLATSALGDEDQKARFLREAQSAALLDHPNIAAVHDIGEQDGHTFMAIAFVDGPELAAKIKERPLKLDEALDIAIQICEGLKEAHEKGVTHRDIKPSNIMLTKKDRVKITDFGLAHLAGRSKLTKSGTSLGTPAYMSPEQALGDPTDRRSDIWGVGAVLYEMIAGKIPFAHEHEQAIIYSIINEPPEPLTAVRTGLPTELDRVVGKALAKKPEERYQHVDDFLVDLRRLRKQLATKNQASVSRSGTAIPGTATKVPETTPDTQRPTRRETSDQVEAFKTQLAAQSRRQAVAFGIGALGLLLALGFAFFLLFQPAPVSRLPLRSFTVPTEGVPKFPSISADGRYVAYITDNETRRGRLWVHDLRTDRTQVVFGPEMVGSTRPVWSPDSRSIVFRVDTELKRISVDGGPAATVCDVGPGRLLYIATWTPDGEAIIFHRESKLYRVPFRGGNPELWLEPRLEGRSAAHPAFLGAGLNKVLYTEAIPSSGGGDRGEIFALDRPSGSRDKLVPGIRPVFAASGHIVYDNVDPAGLWALPFSPETMEATGAAFPVNENGLMPTVARDGTLVYSEGSLYQEQLVWRDRRGNKLGTIGQPQYRITYPTLSPDGRRVAVATVENGNRDIWIHEVDHPQKTRLTTHEASDTAPTWSHDGTKIIFSSGRTGKRDLYRIRADGVGDAELLFSNSEEAQYITGSFREGSLLYGWSMPDTSGTSPGDIFFLEPKGDTSGYEAVPFLETPFDERTPQISPDGRYVAYSSDESGRLEIYIQSFQQGGGRRMVSAAGGRNPRWRADGRELFYVEGTTLMAVVISTSPSLEIGRPETLFSSPGLRLFLPYDVTPNGEKFVLSEQVEETAPVIRVVQNWYEEFREREQ